MYTTYRIEKSHHGKVVNQFASANRDFYTSSSLRIAQDELFDIYTEEVPTFAESWMEAEINNAKGKTTADITYNNGNVMGFDYDGYSYNIVEYHTYAVYYCDDVNEQANLETFLSQGAAEDYIWKEMKDVTKVDAEHPCTDDVFASSAVACYRVYMDESLYDEPQAPVYESVYFYTND